MRLWLNPKDQHWYVTDDDPRVIECFGTDTLPTPFFYPTPVETVLKALRERNSAVVIEVVP